MRRDNSGTYHFTGSEDQTALRWFWDVCMETTFRGRIVLVLRIWFRRPPEGVFGDTK